MNSLLVMPEELRSDDSALITGNRADYIMKFHDLKEGISIPVALYGGRRGKTMVRSIKDGAIELELSLTTAPLSRSNLSLIVAIPRPQSVKKVVQLASMLGVDELLFIKTEKVVKSYLQSKSLDEANIRLEIIKGLEQCGDSIGPEIKIYRSWAESINEVQSHIARNGKGKSFNLIASTKTPSTRDLASFAKENSRSFTTLAIGPESGWTDWEIEQFHKIGFESITLGTRILRVEIACTYLLGQIGLLRSLTS